jgi:hypothetical protein
MLCKGCPAYSAMLSLAYSAAFFSRHLPVADSASASASRNKIVKIMKIFVDIDKIKS